MAEPGLAAATLATASKTTTNLSMVVIILGVILISVLLFLLWNDPGLVLPRWFESNEIRRQKMNSWWLQAYHEKRLGRRPTGILRRTSSSSSTMSNNVLDDSSIIFNMGKENTITAETGAATRTEETVWIQKKRAVKHVRFEAPVMALPHTFEGHENQHEEQRIMKEYDSRRCSAETWDY